MTLPSEWWHRVSRLRGRRGAERRLREEMQFHVEQQTARFVREGRTPADARRAALLEFGNVEVMKESARDEFRMIWLEDLWRDTLIGVRSLARAPGFALATIVTLGLGLGAATTMFSVVNGVLLQSLPYPGAGQLVRAFQIDKDGNRMPVSEPNYNDWVARTASYSAMAELAFAGAVSVVGAFEPHFARAATVSRDFFAVMGVSPARGRAFAPAELVENGAPAVIVSDAYWNRVFGPETAIGNATLRTDNLTYHIIGVMPAGFSYPANTDLWFARELNPPQTSRTAHNFGVIARMRPGVDAAAASRELSTVSRAMKAEYGADTWMADAVVVPLRDQLTATARPTLAMLFGAAVFLLVIACTNAFNLLAVRAASRAREWAVRLTLGAGRWRVARQSLTESVLLCLAGGTLGVLVAMGGVAMLVRLQPGTVPRSGEVGVDWPTLAFAFGVSVLIAMVLTVATFIRPSRGELAHALSAGGRSSPGSAGARRVRESLLVAQVALTLVLLVGASLLTRSFLRVLEIDPGYRTDDALVVDLTLPARGEYADVARRAAFQEAVTARLGALPGVTSVGLINDFPVSGGRYANGTFAEMNAADEIRTLEQYGRILTSEPARLGQAGFRVASEGYFASMSIPVLHGRAFTPSDGANDAVHVAVVSRSLADTRWAGRDPIGRFLQFGNMDGDLRGLRIIGVVEDVREFGLEIPPGPLVYVLNRQRPGYAARFSVVVRGPRPEAVSAGAQRAIRELAPDLPVVTRTMAGALDRALAGRRFSLIVIGVFAAAALALASVGLYGIVSYLTNQRQREIGIRLALGAGQWHVLRIVVGRAAALSALGMCIGVGAAYASSRVVSSFLFGIAPGDPVAFTWVVGVLTVAVALASYIPARRASRAAPVMALRTD